MTAEVDFWNSAYSGYFDLVIASVKFVDPMKTASSSTMPATVHCSADPAATAPKAKTVNSDLAFWGKLAFEGNYDGFRIIDISRPHTPVVLSGARPQ